MRSYQLRSRSRRWAAFLGALASAGALLGVLTQASPASASSWTQLYPGYTGPVYGYGTLCLDVQAAVFQSGVPVREYQCNGTDAQRWTPVSAGISDNAFYLETDLGAYCLGLWSGSIGNGTQVTIFPCTNQQNPLQVWYAQPGGALVLGGSSTGWCLDDPGFATNGHTQLQMWACNGGANQVWLGQQP